MSWSLSLACPPEGELVVVGGAAVSAGYYLVVIGTIGGGGGRGGVHAQVAGYPDLVPVLPAFGMMPVRVASCASTPSSAVSDAAITVAVHTAAKLRAIATI